MPVAVATMFFSNPMENDGNSSLGQARAKRLSAFVPQKRERTFGLYFHTRHIRKRATYTAPNFHICYYTKKELQSQANTNKCSYFYFIHNMFFCLIISVKYNILVLQLKKCGYSQKILSGEMYDSTRLIS